MKVLAYNLLTFCISNKTYRKKYITFLHDFHFEFFANPEKKINMLIMQ